MTDRIDESAQIQKYGIEGNHACCLERVTVNDVAGSDCIANLNTCRDFRAVRSTSIQDQLEYVTYRRRMPPGLLSSGNLDPR